MPSNRLINQNLPEVRPWIGKAMAMAILMVLVGSLLNALAFGGSGLGMPEEKGKEGQALPAMLVDVGIQEHLGAQLPLDAKFLNEAGQEVTLGSYFRGKPVLLNFAYFQCPMLCNMVLNGMLTGMKKLPWIPGNEFEVVTISIDPREGPSLASAKKQTHIAELGKPEAAKGWHFLTGKEKDIRKVADAVGFTYQYNRVADDYAHAAGIFTISPEGKISRYLYGIEFRTKDIRLALLDASEGRSLSFGEKLTLFCYRYDASAKGYVLFAQNFMKGGGYLVVALLFLLLAYFWRKEFKKGRVLRPTTVGTGA